MQTPSTVFRPWATVLLALALAACGGEGGGTGSASGTESGTTTATGGATSGATSTTGPSDGEACAFGCSVDADCCIGAGHPSAAALSDLACPGTRYPNNVACVQGRCVNTCSGAGNECPPPLACRNVGGDDLCVETCASDNDCDDFAEASSALQTHCTDIVDPTGGPAEGYCSFFP
jgi:hypothetical protein